MRRLGRALILAISVLSLAGCSAIRINYFGPNHLYRLSDTDDATLTVDDGPCPNTPRTLEILRENNIKAVFFLRGDNAQKYPELVAQIVADGHMIGNHTFSHAKLLGIPLDVAKQEILLTQDILGAPADRKWFRPPRGELPRDLSDWLETNGFTIWRWSAGPLRPGHIILFHETDEGMESLPGLAAQIKAFNEQ